MVIWDNLLSEQSKNRLEYERNEVARIYQLPDRWLASEILKLARAVQVELYDSGLYPTDIVYDATFAWQLLPELSKRLGATRFGVQERTDSEITRLSNSKLRERVGQCLFNCGTQSLRDSILTREPANGNPVVFALDRISFPEKNDPVATRLAEIAYFREVEFDGLWTPEFMSEKSAKDEASATGPSFTHSSAILRINA